MNVFVVNFSGGRTLVRGRFYTREGRHVSTVMQQVLMRKR